MQDGTKAGLLFASEGAFFVIAAVGAAAQPAAAAHGGAVGAVRSTARRRPRAAFSTNSIRSTAPKIKNCVTLSSPTLFPHLTSLAQNDKITCDIYHKLYYGVILCRLR